MKFKMKAIPVHYQYAVHQARSFMWVCQMAFALVKHMEIDVPICSEKYVTSLQIVLYNSTGIAIWRYVRYLMDPPN